MAQRLQLRGQKEKEDRDEDEICDLIVMAPESPSICKIRISSQAMLIFFGAFVLSFSLAVALAYCFPAEKLNELNRSRLQAENQALEIENKNLELRTHKLNFQLSTLEQTSKRITDLLETD